ncbi:MAG: hypothetical protein K0S63_1313 [Gammaproteobacteria bacterium]|jgi:endonuclease/exonuclease/phosphatase family metal-dependent hydrolase|nr:hypothetical protein [Gammaproteobacteria bacterium]
MKFTLLTYNIHKGFPLLGKRLKLPEMREALIAQNTDLVCLQEVHGEHTKHQSRFEKWPKEPHVEYFSETHWLHHAYGRNAIYKHGDHGNGVMSKFAIVEWENINVAQNTFSSRSLLHVKVEFENKPLHIICVHLGLFEAEREKQFGTLSNRINSHVPKDEPLIIAGDFNDWRRQAEKHLCETLELRDACMEFLGEHPKTFPAVLPLLRVDRIYYRGLKLIDCLCLKDKVWRGLSDHLPLKATFTL